MSALPVARRAYAAYLVGDKAGLVAQTHPDATWSFPGDPAIVPWAGEFQGHDIARFVDLVIDHLDYLEIRVESWSEVGERVFVQAYERFLVRATGRVCENRYLAVFRVRDEKVVHYEEYSDTAAMERALL